MRILQVCPRVPWPPNDGGRVAMLEIARGLADHGVDVEVLSLDPAKHRGEPGAARRALAPIPLETVAIDTSAFVRAALVARRRGLPWLVARFWSPRLARRLAVRLATSLGTRLGARLGAGRIDVVHLESPFLLPYVPTIRAASRVPVVLRSQNVEFRIWEHLAAGERRRWRRATLARLAASLRRWEIAHLDDADGLVPISPRDESELRSLGATRPSLVLPCGVDVADLPPAQTGGGDPFSFYFVGSMLYRPNLEAVEWIVERLWPLVTTREPRVRLTVAGSGLPAALRDRLTAAGITSASDVVDLTRFASSFGAMIAPLFSGSGMRIKVLEAMALGKPVIATPLGVGGIEVTPGRNALVVEGAEAFADAVVRCAGDRELAAAIGAAARSLVEERYDRRRLAAELVDFYRRLAAGAT